MDYLSISFLCLLFNLSFQYQIQKLTFTIKSKTFFFKLNNYNDALFNAIATATSMQDLFNNKYLMSNDISLGLGECNADQSINVKAGDIIYESFTDNDKLYIMYSDNIIDFVCKIGQLDDPDGFSSLFGDVGGPFSISWSNIIDINLIKLTIHFCLNLEDVNFGIDLKNKTLNLEKIDNCFWNYEFETENDEFSFKTYLSRENIILRQEDKFRNINLTKMIEEKEVEIRNCYYEQEKEENSLNKINILLKCEIK